MISWPSLSNLFLRERGHKIIFKSVNNPETETRPRSEEIMRSSLLI